MESSITAVTARQVFTDRGHPGLEATVITQNGARGVARCTAGVSAGRHEVKFVYDGGAKWQGLGVGTAVENVNGPIASALRGMDATRQLDIDEAMLNIGGPGAKERLGGNALAAVSAAALKAGSAALGIPLYQHIGGVGACVLPVPAAYLGGGHNYGIHRPGEKPGYSMVCFGFGSYSEASYAAWELSVEWPRLLSESMGGHADLYSASLTSLQLRDERELWDMLVKLIVRTGYEARVGIQIDVAAAGYYDEGIERYRGLFSAEDKTRDDLFRLYESMVKDYPFVIVEDPLEDTDFEGHAILTRSLGIQVVGDDLFATNPVLLRRGIESGAANAVLLKVNQIGTISEAFEFVRLAQRYGYAVMPCSSRGEGRDIADYCVGLNTGQVREGATDETANRLLEIEAELGSQAQFLGSEALMIGPSMVGHRHGTLTASVAVRAKKTASQPQ